MPGELPDHQAKASSSSSSSKRTRARPAAAPAPADAGDTWSQTLAGALVGLGVVAAIGWALLTSSGTKSATSPAPKLQVVA